MSFLQSSSCSCLSPVSPKDNEHDRLYTEDELPPEFKLFLPVAGKPQGQ